MNKTYRFTIDKSKKKSVSVAVFSFLTVVLLVAWVFHKPFLESRESARAMATVNAFAGGYELPESEEYRVTEEEAFVCQKSGLERLSFHSLSSGACLGLVLSVPNSIVSMGVNGQEKCLGKDESQEPDLSSLCISNSEVSVFVSRSP